MKPTPAIALTIAFALPAATLLAQTPAPAEPVAALTVPTASAAAATVAAVPELADASLPELREALNDISDQSIEAARRARDLATDLEAAVVNSTVSTPEIDELRARRNALLKELSAAETALRAAILRSDEFKERAAEAEAARAKADALAARRVAIRALLSQRRSEASRPEPKE